MNINISFKNTSASVFVEKYKKRQNASSPCLLLSCCTYSFLQHFLKETKTLILFARARDTFLNVSWFWKAR